MWTLGLIAAALAAPGRHALVVGVNDGGGVLEPLRYAERDAEAFAEVLEELGGFPVEELTVLYAPDAERLQRAIAAHAALAQTREDDLFLFYYSGHADARGLRLGDEVYHFEALRQDLRAIPADVRVGVLDACRSGAITRLKGASTAPPLAMERRLAAEGEAWMTASSADELAQESDQLRGGFFSHYLISGLRGAADTGDGVVGLNELYRYAFDRVVAHTGGTDAGAQHPHFDFQLAGKGEVVLADLRVATAAAILPLELHGSISILELPSGDQLLEVDKVVGVERRLALPPGRYLARRRTEEGLEEVVFGLEPGASLRLDRWSRTGLDSGVARGMEDVAAIEAYVAESERRIREQGIGRSPALAGTMSAMLPGAGQLYNGQSFKGIAYFGATASLLGGTYLAGQEGSNSQALGLSALGLALWGASIADASYNVHRREDATPEGGVILSVGARGDDRLDARVGLTAEVHVLQGLYLGLDQLGAGWNQEGDWDAHLGSRLRYRLARGVLSPSVLVSAGLRSGQLGAERLSRPVFGVGVDARYHPVPRYFLATELRWDGDAVGGGLGLGLQAGVHLGR